MQESWVQIDGKYQKVFVPVKSWKPKSKAQKEKEAKAKRLEKKNRQQAGKQIVQERIKRSKHTTEARAKSEPSKGEARIIKFLTENSIPFKREHFHKRCYNYTNGHLLYFDFWIPSYDLIIEYDGIHHFKPVYGQHKLDLQKEKDRMKNWYCRVNNIHLLRIACFDDDRIEEIICQKFDEIAPVARTGPHPAPNKKPARLSSWL